MSSILDWIYSGDKVIYCKTGLISNFIFWTECDSGPQRLGPSVKNQLYLSQIPIKRWVNTDGPD